MTSPKTILITGASGGLGSALALGYAAPGVKLILIGRNNDKLNEIANLCIAQGAEVEGVSLDVRGKIEMSEFIAKLCNQESIDIAIACAGVSAGTLRGPESPSQVEIIFDTNINGVLNTIMPIIPHMIAKKLGTIVIVSSMASFTGLSSAPSYSATKACVRLFGEALRGYLQQYNVKTIVVIPGYIKTNMTQVNNFPMPFMVSAEKAAQKIIRGIESNKGIIAFPLIMYVFVKILTLLPNRLISYINSKIPGKPAFERE